MQTVHELCNRRIVDFCQFLLHVFLGKHKNSGIHTRTQHILTFIQKLQYLKKITHLVCVVFIDYTLICIIVYLCMCTYAQIMYIYACRYICNSIKATNLSLIMIFLRCRKYAYVILLYIIYFLVMYIFFA